MKIKEVLERVARVQPSAYDDETAAEWLAELDGQLRLWVNENFEEQIALPQKYTEDSELFVEMPYDRVYDFYIMVQADAMNKEDDYNNSALLFNQTLDEFRKAYHRTHRRKAAKPVIHIW